MPVGMTSCLPVEEAVTPCVPTGVEPLTPSVDVRLVERKSSPDAPSKNSSSSFASMVSCLPVEDAVPPCVSTDVVPLTPSVDFRLVKQKSSPSWEDLGPSLAQLLWQHKKAGPTPYSDKIMQKADNYQRLLAQYKCHPFLEVTATTSIPASGVAPATTTSTFVSVTAQPLLPVMTFTEPESVTPALAFSSPESVTPLLHPPVQSYPPSSCILHSRVGYSPSCVLQSRVGYSPSCVLWSRVSYSPSCVLQSRISYPLLRPPVQSRLLFRLHAPMHCPHLSLTGEPLSMSLDLLSGPRVLLVPLHPAGHLFCLSW